MAGNKSKEPYRLTRWEPRHERFCQVYNKTMSTKEAALAAGYAKKSAAELGRRLLTAHRIQQRIAELELETLCKVDVTEQQVLAVMKQVAFSHESKPSERLRAAELLGKHLKMFTEQKEVTHKGQAQGPSVQVIQFKQENSDAIEQGKTTEHKRIVEAKVKDDQGRDRGVDEPASEVSGDGQGHIGQDERDQPAG